MKIKDTVLWYKFYNRTEHILNLCKILCQYKRPKIRTPSNVVKECDQEPIGVTCEVHSMLRDNSFLILLFFYSGFLCLALVWIENNILFSIKFVA